MHGYSEGAFTYADAGSVLREIFDALKYLGQFTYKNTHRSNVLKSSNILHTVYEAR